MSSYTATSISISFISVLNNTPLSVLSLCNPLDCSSPGSSVLEIFQARALEWLPFPSPGDLPDPGMEPTSLASPELQEGALPAGPSGRPAPLYGWTMCVYPFINWWTCGCFHFGAIIHSATMIISVQVFIWTYVFNFLRSIPRSGMAGSYSNSMYNFWGAVRLFFHIKCVILHSHCNVWGFQFLHMLTSTFLFSTDMIQDTFYYPHFTDKKGWCHTAIN